MKRAYDKLTEKQKRLIDYFMETGNKSEGAKLVRLVSSGVPNRLIEAAYILKKQSKRPRVRGLFALLSKIIGKR